MTFAIRHLSAMLRRVIPALDDDGIAAELKAAIRRGQPARVMIDPSMPYGTWVIVRGLVSPQEQALHDKANGVDRCPGWEDTTADQGRCR